MVKNDNIIKDPAAAARRGAIKRKGKKHPKTIIKEKIRSWDMAAELVEKNILEFLESKNKKERLLATKYFAEYVKPKLRDVKKFEEKHKFSYNLTNILDRIKEEKKGEIREIREVKEIGEVGEAKEVNFNQNFSTKIEGGSLVRKGAGE